MKIKRKVLVTVGTIIGAILGAMGGSGKFDKNWRRIGISSLLALAAFLSGGGWASLLFFLWAIGLGYGVPDETDDGSTLGQFWYQFTEGKQPLTDICVRGSVGLIRGTVALIYAILAGKTLAGVVGLPFFALAAISSIWWRKLGNINIGDFYLTWDELGVWACLTCVALVVII